jgi:hypothetical protein
MVRINFPGLLGCKNVESLEFETMFKADFMFINTITAEYLLGCRLVYVGRNVTNISKYL